MALPPDTKCAGAYLTTQFDLRLLLQTEGCFNFLVRVAVTTSITDCNELLGGSFIKQAALAVVSCRSLGACLTNLTIHAVQLWVTPISCVIVAPNAAFRSRCIIKTCSRLDIRLLNLRFGNNLGKDHHHHVSSQPACCVTAISLLPWFISMVSTTASCLSRWYSSDSILNSDIPPNHKCQ